ncbi:PPOX class F420-dependent oxidoreductase [Kribbella speibonae]|uniref:PPOX class F420-dependent oxidoreductase n=1 Tax=Kribbella speibonae TaxID=1572660 RepID=A0A4R0J3R3_9ACTN|nr:PPOX class F420-dependent oxidoreductase [Kribbella speibonae]TCC21176.1 PPOX class F420-dependent oxidoreductase [Kribbella speibonae]TCC41183.1 PPOX class F420-dependent oxidoreductase [Kribbella speibonae]
MNLPQSTHRLFDEPKDVTLITIDPDGSPHAAMVWVGRDGDDLLIGVEEKHRKTRNLRRDPRVTLVLQDDRVSPRGLTQYLVVRGTAKLERDPQRYKELMDRLSKKYLGRDEFPFWSEEVSANATVVRVVADRVTGEGPWAVR